MPTMKICTIDEVQKSILRCSAPPFCASSCDGYIISLRFKQVLWLVCCCWIPWNVQLYNKALWSNCRPFRAILSPYLLNIPTQLSTVVWFLCVYSSLRKEAQPQHIQMCEPCATYVGPHVQCSNISVAVSKMSRLVFVRFVVYRTTMYAWGHEGLVIESTLLKNVWMYEQSMGHYWMMWLLIIQNLYANKQ